MSIAPVLSSALGEPQVSVRASGPFGDITLWIGCFGRMNAERAFGLRIIDTGRDLFRERKPPCFWVEGRRPGRAVMHVGRAAALEVAGRPESVGPLWVVATPTFGEFLPLLSCHTGFAPGIVWLASPWSDQGTQP